MHGVDAQNYPFCTIEPNVGVVAVPDERLEVLAKMHDSEKITPAIVEFVDIAGLVKGASKGEGLGNKFLSHIREVDSILEVVRCFDDSNIVHVDGSIDPIRDIDTINVELVLADLETVEKRIDRVAKLAKGDKKYLVEEDAFKKVRKGLEEGIPVRQLDLTDDEKALIKDAFLLTEKPILYVANISENEIGTENEYVKKVKELAEKEHTEAIVLCARIEEEISNLDSEEEKKEMLEAMGLTESGLDQVIKKSYDILGLMSYLTTGKKETRAWTINKGTKAPQAAGKIHSDFERGFIKAEIISYDDLIRCGGYQQAKEKGLIRQEGKDYIMQEGDIVEFKFNV